MFPLNNLACKELIKLILESYAKRATAAAFSKGEGANEGSKHYCDPHTPLR